MGFQPVQFIGINFENFWCVFLCIWIKIILTSLFKFLFFILMLYYIGIPYKI